jgi:GTP pyrophosphokinase
MVLSVADSIPKPPVTPGFDPERWVEAVASAYPPAQRSVILRACHTAIRAHEGQRRASGEPYVQHSLAVAAILAGLGLDHETVTAALLHDVAEDTGVAQDQIRKDFGETVARLVDGVTKMKLIQAYKSLPEHDKQERVQAENLRKMLLAMAEDIRVVLIKLADRTHNMRTLSALPAEKQKRIARETLEIYAPLANRLGIWQLKWELEDLAFRYLEPDLYERIVGALAEQRDERERQIADFIAVLRGELAKAGLNADLSGRSKHIYSIWRKMARKNIELHQVRDVRGVRVLVDTVQDCYKALGVVHGLWQYIPGEFDDYIATPKENDYRSIHTAVIGPDGLTFEIQIRTHEMHKQNELGVAAHWRYKEGGREDPALNRRVAWLRQLLEWKDELVDAGEFVDRFRTELFEDRIYVFTPKGKVIDLPKGATPLDFAYLIHTEIGHRCRGAKVDGHMVPLTYSLNTGEQVEILTVKESAPSRDWLNPHLGYLKTARARAKVQHWFRLQDRDKNIAAGRAMLEKDLRRLGLFNVNQEKLAEKLGYSSGDDMFVSISHNELKSARYLQVAQNLAESRPGVVESGVARRPPAERAGTGGFQVLGVGNLLSHVAHCCRPVPGDDIRGYITIGRGVSVHRRDCPNILRYSTRCPERVIEVEWEARTQRTFPVDVQIRAFDRKGLLNDVTAIVVNEGINVTAINTLAGKRDHVIGVALGLEVPDIDTLNRLLTKIGQLPNVLSVNRVTH